MTTQQAISALRQRGYSKRKIARELGIHRNTVSHYLEIGDQHIDRQSVADIEPEAEPPPKCTTPSPGSSPSAIPREAAGSQSQCEPFRELIESKLEAQLTAKRIWIDLVEDHGFKHGYQSVKRFVAKLRQSTAQRVWRIECEPGQEAQVDYGTQFLRIEGRSKKIHLLRVTLSHSRKGYTEAMPRQDTESFIRGIENAFRHFGGAPRILVLDNLKAGVLKPSLYDAELNPKFASFCEHYNVVALPTRPRTPEHKGKVENGVGYVKGSATRGRAFESLHELNLHLRHWERTTADKRIHGTTKRQVESHFEQGEKAALQPLPENVFPSFVEAQRSVHRDSYVEFEKAYYEAPPEYISRPLWVRSDGRLVRLFNLRMEQVAVHPKLEPGQFTRVLACGGAPQSVEESLRRWKRRARQIGPETARWAEGVILHRREAGLRVLMGLVNNLHKKYDSAALEAACAKARLHGQYHLKELRQWLEQPTDQQTFSFLSEHELIRDLREYGKIVNFEQRN